ncbi:hypothetical protein AK812_SmicGene4116 [Symbiodinium microadriaticum]|uniref:Uncharacterized protein n=1 Tax=Symbiodinium microadriaticum TaxID=2951 RepID=A0A1Q9EX68_SYMMI|nr:hypothetical protein AK812_SmicGene4116 [Symbiodinium microadriaticum]
MPRKIFPGTLRGAQAGGLRMVAEGVDEGIRTMQVDTRSEPQGAPMTTPIPSTAAMLFLAPSVPVTWSSVSSVKQSILTFLAPGPEMVGCAPTDKDADGRPRLVREVLRQRDGKHA